MQPLRVNIPNDLFKLSGLICLCDRTSKRKCMEENYLFHSPSLILIGHDQLGKEISSSVY